MHSVKNLGSAAGETAWGWILAILLATLLALAVPRPSVAQEIPRGEYIRYLPLEYPRLVRQTDANTRLHLFGDPADPMYRDESPRDGIDDHRGEILSRLAVRFAP